MKVALLDFPSAPFAIMVKVYVPRATLEEAWNVTLLFAPEGESVVGLEDHVAVIPLVIPETENETL